MGVGLTGGVGVGDKRGWEERGGGMEGNEDCDGDGMASSPRDDQLSKETSRALLSVKELSGKATGETTSSIKPLA